MRHHEIDCLVNQIENYIELIEKRRNRNSYKNSVLDQIFSRLTILWFTAKDLQASIPVDKSDMVTIIDEIRKIVIENDYWGFEHQTNNLTNLLDQIM